MKIIVGKKYKVKSWEKMERQYGLTRYGYIDTPACFVSEMKKFCGKVVTITKNFSWYRIEEDKGRFAWDECMFEPFENSIEYYIEKRKNNG